MREIQNSQKRALPDTYGAAPASTTGMIHEVPNGSQYTSMVSVNQNGQQVAQWYPGNVPSPVPAGRPRQ